MTALELRQEAESTFAADARRNREELTTALAALTAQANLMLETSLLVEHEAQMRTRVDYRASAANVALITSARNETKRALDAVTRACGVSL